MNTGRLSAWLGREPLLFAVAANLRDRLAPGYGEAELALLPHVVECGEVACDVGANNGIYTSRLLALARRVIAFEPNPRMCRMLHYRFPLAVRSGRLRIEPVALGDADGEAVLQVPRDASGLGTFHAEHLSPMLGAIETMRVPVRRLDDYGAERIGFLKIDVEGHEAATVEGGMRLIARDHPTILLESEERLRPGGLAALARAFAGIGYEGFYLDGGRLRPLSAFDPARDQNVAALVAEGSRRRPGATYINNFLFVARPGVRDRLAAAGLLAAPAAVS